MGEPGANPSSQRHSQTSSVWVCAGVLFVYKESGVFTSSNAWIGSFCVRARVNPSSNYPPWVGNTAGANGALRIALCI